MRAACVGLALGLTSLALPSVGHAQVDPEALLADGVRLREAGRDEEALALFTKAYATVPTPRSRAQMALAEQALGRWLAAHQHLREALAATGDAWVQRHREALEGALRTVEAHVGSLELRDGVPGALVRLDGERLGTLPLAGPVPAEAGEYDLQVTMPGFYPLTRRVRIEAGVVTRESVAMRALDRPGDGASDRSPAAQGAAGASPSREDPHSESAGAVATGAGGGADASDPADTTLRSLAWVGIGAGVVAAVGGVVALAARDGRVQAYNEDPSCPGLDEPGQPPLCADAITAANTLLAVGVSSLVGGVLLGGAGVFALVWPGARAASAQASFGLAPGAGARVVLEGRF